MKMNEWAGKSCLNRYSEILSLTGFVLIGGYLFYPGLLDGDGHALLWEALHEHFEDYNSAFLGVIWWALINVTGMSSSLLFVQLILLWLSGYSVLRVFGKRGIWSYLILVVLMYPPVMGYAGALVKDVWFGATAVLLVSMSVVAVEKPSYSRWVLTILLGSACVLFRHNAIFWILPVMLVAVFIAYPRTLKACLIFGVCTVSVFVISYTVEKLISLSFKYEDFYPEQQLFLFDLAAISLLEDELLVPEAFLNGETLESLQSKFNKTSNMPIIAWDKKDQDGLLFLRNEQDNTELRNAWMHGIWNHPKSYIVHRGRMTFAVLGLSRAHDDIYHHQLVSPNPFGHGPYVENVARRGYIKYMTLFERSPFNKLYLYVLLFVGGWVTAVRPTETGVRIKNLYRLSAAGMGGYLVSLMGFAPNVGFRYMWPFVFASVITCIVQFVPRRK